MKAKATVRGQINELKDKLKLAKETIATFRAEMEKTKQIEELQSC